MELTSSLYATSRHLTVAQAEKPRFSSCLSLLVGCKSGKTAAGSSIKFTRVPETTQVNPDKLDIIQGRVEGARQGQQIVLYAKRGEWWLQPLSTAPFAAILPDSSWINSTRLGSEYAALLVEPGYLPQPTMNALPVAGNNVAARLQRRKTFRPLTLFQQPCNSADTNGGFVMHRAIGVTAPIHTVRLNAWTDDKGALHLRIAKESDKWTCAEVTLTRSFGS